MTRIPTPVTIADALHMFRSMALSPRVKGRRYCLSAQTYLGRDAARLDYADIAAKRNGASNDPKAAVAVRFAAEVARERGRATDADFSAIQHAGHADAQIIEIVGDVALNTLTNDFNVVFQTEIDFPIVEARRAA